jgi:hypothetical protein
LVAVQVFFALVSSIAARKMTLKCVVCERARETSEELDLGVNPFHGKVSPTSTQKMPRN